MAPLLPIIEPMINKAVEAAAPGMSPIVDGVINEAVEISGPLAKALRGMSGEISSWCPLRNVI